MLGLHFQPKLLQLFYSCSNHPREKVSESRNKEKVESQKNKKQLGIAFMSLVTLKSVPVLGHQQEAR